VSFKSADALTERRHTDTLGASCRGDIAVIDYANKAID
jgi:hypothetical protein